MIPIVCIVGHSKSGKTALVERLIGELKRRALRVAAVKHAHEDFDVDRQGKDSWRFARAGCDAVAILGPKRSVVMKKHDADYSFQEPLLAAGHDADAVLVEGLSSGPYPKIEVHRSSLEQGLRCKPEELMAVVTDEPLDIGCRQFPPGDIGAIADLIEEEIVGGIPDGAMLTVNSEPVSLGSFTRKIISNTVLGLVSSLKGIDRIRTLSVLIRTKAGSSKFF